MQPNFKNNQNMKPVLFSILFFFIVAFSFAQTESKSYYVTVSGDTISGFIFKIHNTFFYKTSKETREKKVLEIEFVKTIRLNGGIEFEKKEITSTKNGKVETITAFAKTILTGPCSLYSIIKPSKEDEDLAFCIEKNCKSYILSQNTSSNINITNQDTRYLTMLQFLLGDCDSVKKMIPNVLFEEVSLAWIVRSYNKCIDSKNKTESFTCKPEEKIDIHKKPKSIPLEYFNKRIVYLTYASLLSKESGEDDRVSYSNLSAYGFGLSYFSLKPKLSKLITFSIGLRCMKYKYSINPNYSTIYNIPVEKYIVDLPLSLNVHIINKQNLTAYISSGIEISYAKTIKISNNEMYSKEWHEKLTSKLTSESNTHLRADYTFGIGCIYKHLFTQISLSSLPLLMYISAGYSF